MAINSEGGIYTLTNFAFPASQTNTNTGIPSNAVEMKKLSYP